VDYQQIYVVVAHHAESQSVVVSAWADRAHAEAEAERLRANYYTRPRGYGVKPLFVFDWPPRADAEATR